MAAKSLEEAKKAASPDTIVMAHAIHTLATAIHALAQANAPEDDDFGGYTPQHLDDEETH